MKVAEVLLICCLLATSLMLAGCDSGRADVDVCVAYTNTQGDPATVEYHNLTMHSAQGVVDKYDRSYPVIQGCLPDGYLIKRQGE